MAIAVTVWAEYKTSILYCIIFLMLLVMLPAVMVIDDVDVGD